MLKNTLCKWFESGEVRVFQGLISHLIGLKVKNVSKCNKRHRWNVKL